MTAPAAEVIAGETPATDGAVAMRDVLLAARRLRGVVRRTPLEHSAALSRVAGVEAWLKLENLQRTGSFKVRGATNALLSLSAAELKRGVVSASAGNHGLGVAFAARLRGAAATIFVPAGASRAKRTRIAALGAELREVAGSYEDAHEEALRFAARTGALYLHAFSDPRVVAGQGTVGLEILEELPEVATLLVPVGGGGLIGGVGLVARALAPDARMLGVQSEATAAMHASLLAGRLVTPPMPPTLCDGLTGEIDARSLALARRVVDRMLLVTEAAIGRAMRRLFLEEGMVVEGSAATVAAALYAGQLGGTPGPIAAVLSGGNLDASVLTHVLQE